VGSGGRSGKEGGEGDGQKKGEGKGAFRQIKIYDYTPAVTFLSPVKPSGPSAPYVD